MHIDPFITYLKTEKRYSSYTLKAYENDLSQFFDYIGKTGHEQDDCKPEYQQIRRWIVYMMEQGLSSRSVKRKVSAIGSYCRYLLRNGLIETNPLIRITIPKSGKRLPAFIPEEKLDNLLDDVDFGDDFSGVRNRLIIETLYFTGMRRSEMIKIVNSDVDTYDMVIKVLGKGDKQRYIPIGQSFSQTLRDYMVIKEKEFGKVLPSDPFFVTGTGKILYPQLIYRIVKKYLFLVSPGPGRSPHILRHSFATHMLNHGADLNAIKELLGHASLAATQVYTHNSFKKLKDIYKQAHPRA